MLLQVEPGLMIWTLVTFVLLLIVLRVVAWKPLLGMLNEREQRIQESLEQADKARQEAQAAAEENREAMTQAQAEAQRAITEGREAAERVAADVRSRAEAEAQQLLQQAQRTIRQEKDQAIQELRNQVADLAILAAGKVLDENLDEGRNRKIVDDFIEGIPGVNRN
ncbi:MAG: ATP synthase F0 subunit B [Gemmatimonadetes bacterium]|nr:ATP synthase F0 subunit B [Gemmatimonadota bacterium]